MSPWPTVLEGKKPQLGRQPYEAEIIESREPSTGTSGGVATMYVELVAPVPQPELTEEQSGLTTESPEVRIQPDSELGDIAPLLGLDAKSNPLLADLWRDDDALVYNP